MSHYWQYNNSVTTAIDINSEPQQAYITNKAVDLKDHEEINTIICMGWLLYLADEFDRAALCKQTWYLTWVSVTLDYQEIFGSLPFPASSPSPQYGLEAHCKSLFFCFQHISIGNKNASCPQLPSLD